MKGLPELVIGDLKVKRPVIQGGMGVGVSLGQLAGAVAKEGGVGIISTAQIGFREPDFETNTRAANIRAIGSEFQRARETAPDGVIGFNIMVALKDYDEHVKAAGDAGADLITVHAEACEHLDRTLHAIKDRGVLAGVALNPATPLSVLDYILPECDMVLLMSVNPGFGGQKYIPYTTQKIRDLKKMMEEKHCQADIEVDGGVSLNNVQEVLDAGANIIVAGTAVFKGDIRENVESFLNIMEK